jgi:hypothetical protein
LDYADESLSELEFNESDSKITDRNMNATVAQNEGQVAAVASRQDVRCGNNVI